MNILIASIQLPWPLDSGGRVALYSSLACLSNDHCFTLVCPVWTEKALSDAVELQARFPRMKIRAVYCGPPKAPPPRQDDFLLRSVRGVAKRYRGWRQEPAPAAVQVKESQVPYYPFAPLPEAFVEAVANEVARGIDLVQAEFVEMLSLGAWLPRDIPKVFIHHQLQFVYSQRLSTARGLGDYSEYLEKVMRAQEETYLRKFDAVVVFSAEDKHALSGWLEDDRVHVSPFPILSGSAASEEFYEPCFSFVGSEAHFPNQDGLEWLVEEVWPKILQHIPWAVLRVTGVWGEASRARYSKQGVEFTGHVEDLHTAIRGSVMLVPLRIGSGIRVKLLDAMSSGVPAVSTSIGCEGIPARDGTDILIRDDEMEFATAAVGLLNDHGLRRRMARAGRDLVLEHYSPERVRKRRNEIYEKVLWEMPCPKPPKHGAAIS
jgi:polysaccharide biosynthesis protein PslH